MLKNFGFLIVSIGIIFSSSQAFARSPKPGSSKGGLYEGYMSNGGKWQKFITTKNISLEEAYKNCRINADNNPSKGILCKYNGFHIYGLAKQGIYRININGRTYKVAKMSKGHAYNHCKSISKYRSLKVMCTLNGKLLYTNQ